MLRLTKYSGGLELKHSASCMQLEQLYRLHLFSGTEGGPATTSAPSTPHSGRRLKSPRGMRPSDSCVSLPARASDRLTDRLAGVCILPSHVSLLKPVPLDAVQLWSHQLMNAVKRSTR